MDTKRLVFVSFALLAALLLFGCADEGPPDNATPIPKGPTGEITVTVTRPQNDGGFASTMEATRYGINPDTQWFRIRAKEQTTGAKAFAEINYTLCNSSCSAVLAVSPGTYTVGVLALKDMTVPTGFTFAATQLLQYGETQGVVVSIGASTQATVNMADSTMTITPPPDPVIWGSTPSISGTTTNFPDDIEAVGMAFEYAVDSTGPSVWMCGDSTPTGADPTAFSCAAQNALPGSGSSIQFGAWVDPDVGGWEFATQQYNITLLAVFSVTRNFVEGSGIGIIIQ